MGANPKRFKAKKIAGKKSDLRYTPYMQIHNKVC